jgi:hypothetical protein
VTSIDAILKTNRNISISNRKEKEKEKRTYSRYFTNNESGSTNDNLSQTSVGGKKEFRLSLRRSNGL